MRNLNQPLHTVHLNDGSRVFEPQGNLFTGSLGPYSSVRAKREAAAGLNRVFGAVGLGREFSEVRNFVIGKFQLGFLFLGGVGRERILVSIPLQELFTNLGNKGRDGSEDIGDGKGDGKSE